MNKELGKKISVGILITIFLTMILGAVQAQDCTFTTEQLIIINKIALASNITQSELINVLGETCYDDSAVQTTLIEHGTQITTQIINNNVQDILINTTLNTMTNYYSKSYINALFDGLNDTVKLMTQQDLLNYTDYLNNILVDVDDLSRIADIFENSLTQQEELNNIDELVIEQINLLKQNEIEELKDTLQEHEEIFVTNSDLATVSNRIDAVEKNTTEWNPTFFLTIGLVVAGAGYWYWATQKNKNNPMMNPVNPQSPVIINRQIQREESISSQKSSQPRTLDEIPMEMTAGNMKKKHMREKTSMEILIDDAESKRDKTQKGK